MRQQIEGVDDQGPWIAAALFCDAVIEDEVGARTLVRLHQGGEFFDAQTTNAYGEPVIFLSFLGGPRRGRFRSRSLVIFLAGCLGKSGSSTSPSMGQGAATTCSDLSEFRPTSRASPSSMSYSTGAYSPEWPTASCMSASGERSAMHRR